MSRGTLHLLLFIAVAWFVYVHWFRGVSIRKNG